MFLDPASSEGGGHGGQRGGRGASARERRCSIELPGAFIRFLETLCVRSNSEDFFHRSSDDLLIGIDYIIFEKASARSASTLGGRKYGREIALSALAHTDTTHIHSGASFVGHAIRAKVRPTNNLEREAKHTTWEMRRSPWSRTRICAPQ